MAQFNIHEAKSNLSRLVELAVNGERIVLAKHGNPVAEIVPIARKGLVLGAGVGDPNINPAALTGFEAWEPMSEEEVDAFIEGRL